MAMEKGAAFLLKVGDGAMPPVFATVGGAEQQALPL